MKPLIRFFLTLCLFLFSGYSLMHTDAAKGKAREQRFYPRHKTSQRPLLTAANSLREQRFLFFRQAPAGTGCDNSGSELEQIGSSEDKDEEDEQGSLRKFVCGIPQFFSIPYFPVTRHCSLYLKKCRQDGKYFSYSSSFIYILFRVIRI